MKIQPTTLFCFFVIGRWFLMLTNHKGLGFENYVLGYIYSSGNRYSLPLHKWLALQYYITVYTFIISWSVSIFTPYLFSMGVSWSKDNQTLRHLSIARRLLRGSWMSNPLLDFSNIIGGIFNWNDNRHNLKKFLIKSELCASTQNPNIFFKISAKWVHVYCVNSRVLAECIMGMW